MNTDPESNMVKEPGTQYGTPKKALANSYYQERVNAANDLADVWKEFANLLAAAHVFRSHQITPTKMAAAVSRVSKLADKQLDQEQDRKKLVSLAKEMTPALYASRPSDHIKEEYHLPRERVKRLYPLAKRVAQQLSAQIENNLYTGADQLDAVFALHELEVAIIGLENFYLGIP